MNLADLHKIGIRASVTDGELRLDAPKGAVDNDLLTQIRESKPALLAEILAVGDAGELCEEYFPTIQPCGKCIDPANDLHQGEALLLEINPETPSTAASYPAGLPTVRDTDDRRTCSQCRNLASRVCTIAKPGGIVSAIKGYRPDMERLRRCAGYLPNGSDADPRPGAERWPYL